MTVTAPIPAPRFAGTLDYLRAWIEYRAWATRTPGVQWAVGVKGEVIASGAWGIADLETGERLSEKHLFRIASHSKTFTATAAMILAQQDRIRLDDVAATHVPELAGSPAGDYTIRDLLAHATGVIRDGYDADFWSLARPFPDESELIAMLRDRAAILPPATRLKYSNVGYSLLGLVLGRATGTPYNELVTELVIRPLGLADTSPELDPARASDYAAGHGALHLTAERARVPHHVDTRAMASATGFTSTARDLIRYAGAHVFGNEELLTDESKRRMQQLLWTEDPQTERGKARGYGLGLVVDTIAGRKIVGHSGGYPGHITQTLWDPETGLTVSALTNALGGAAGEISVGMLKLLLDAGGAAVVDEQPDAALDRFTGRYVNAWGVTDVVRLGGALKSLHPGQADPLEGAGVLVAEPDAGDALRIDGGSGFGPIGEHLEYVRDASGSVERVQGGGGQTLLPVARAAALVDAEPAALIGR